LLYGTYAVKATPGTETPCR